MGSVKKQKEHDDPPMETAVFLLMSSYKAVALIDARQKTKEPITRTQGLRIIGSASVRLALW